MDLTKAQLTGGNAKCKSSGRKTDFFKEIRLGRNPGGRSFSAAVQRQKKAWNRA
jgi:hypothetical protein